jgi:hypothetical protein
MMMAIPLGVTGEVRSARICVDENDLDKGANTVRAMTRRNVLIDSLPVAVVAVAALAIGSSVVPGATRAAQTVQATTVRPHRHMRSRHRRWGCWWERGPHWWHWGRRVCGWR